MERLRRLLLQENIAFEDGCPLDRHSSFRIGGPAALAVFPSTRDALLQVLTALSSCEIHHAVIGNGSNVLFSDAGYDGVVVFTSGWKEIKRNDTELCASAGVSLLSLSRMALEASLSGLEFAYGIPGTLGGAVLMNAGAYGGEIASVCVESEYFDAETQTVATFYGAAQEFGYRTSIYETHPRYTVLGAKLVLKNDTRDAIFARMEDCMSRRKGKQPLELPNAGSIFKRPDGCFAGKLIEDCGLKGYRIGGAEVSEKHAGFIVNRGGATASDVCALIEHIRSRVLSEFGVELECEIRLIGE